MKRQIDQPGQAGSHTRCLNDDAGLGTQAGSLPLARRVRAFLRRGEEGSVLVEISLLTPILLAMLTAIATFAVGFNNQLTLTSAVDAGGRQLQLIRTTSTDPCADTLAAIEAAAPNLTPGSLTLTFTFTPTSTPLTSKSCPGDQSMLAQSSAATVSATYPCVLSIMPMGYGTKFVSSCQLSAKVTEYEY
jgi:Flp pilus assembly protein TadG